MKIVASLARSSRCLFLAACLAACMAPPASAQNQIQVAPAPGADPNAPPPLFATTAPTDPTQIHMMKAMAKERNVIRQKEIVADTTQLLNLAKQLKEAVDKSSKDQLSLSVVDTAAQIEKLAKSVKDKMRDGQ
ncbi:MAG TPA: hypothetical protein VHX60_18845 [Acidobacteriaceae bacterium]|jgi:hypothetical protein|nr:hypothetical protein [Acidobacteriaceae bacterium]